MNEPQGSEKTQPIDVAGEWTQVIFRPERVFVDKGAAARTKAGADIGHWCSPTFLRDMSSMDWLILRVTFAYQGADADTIITHRHRARAMRQRARRLRRWLAGETAGMGCKRLRRAIARGNAAAWKVV